MSYDFDLFLPASNLAHEEAIRLRKKSDEAAKTLISPDEAARLRQTLARVLQEHNPKLEIIDVDMSKDETLTASLPPGFELPGLHVVLDDSKRGVQISIFGSEAGVSIAYWHQGRAAEQVLKQVWTYLKVLKDHGGYLIYDPQVDAPLDLEVDFQTVLRKYIEGGNLGKKMISKLLKNLPPDKPQ